MSYLNRFAAAALGASLALYAGATPGAEASARLAVQQTAQTQPAPGDQPGVTRSQETQMMGMHQQMMAEMKAMDDRLDALVATMKAAQGDAKIEAMASVVSTLVEQRSMMRERQMQMQARMMGHMMQHMSGGMGPGMMQKAMAECPMMKEMTK